MKLIYIAHPLGAGAEREANRARAARWVDWAARCGAAPVATWITLSGMWGEDRRELGLAIDCALAERCDEVWLVGGRVSEGMRIEAAAAERAGVTVRDLTCLGPEPPPIYPEHPSRVVLVTGSRDWTDAVAISSALDGATLVLHGGARGADELADAWAREHSVQRVVLSADWERLGRRAGAERNALLVERACELRARGNAVEVWAFPLPQSRGTWDCVHRARAAGLVVHVHSPKTLWGERA